MMKKYKSIDMLERLQAEAREIILAATYLQTLDPEILSTQPGPGRWSIVQVLAHLNSYGSYYLLALEKSLNKDEPATEFFKPGWLGNYFTKLMKPGENGLITNKMQSPRDHRPSNDLDAMPVLEKFLEQQHYLLQLLELAKSKNISSLRTPISISRFIRLKVGDTFRFLIAHEQRHMLQIHHNVAALRITTGRFQEARPAM